MTDLLTTKKLKKIEYAKTFLMLEKAARSLDDLIKENNHLAGTNRKLRQEIKDALNLANARERVLQSFYKKYVTEKEENQDSEE